MIFFLTRLRTLRQCPPFCQIAGAQLLAGTVTRKQRGRQAEFAGRCRAPAPSIPDTRLADAFVPMSSHTSAARRCRCACCRWLPVPTGAARPFSARGAATALFWTPWYARLCGCSSKLPANVSRCRSALVGHTVHHPSTGTTATTREVVRIISKLMPRSWEPPTRNSWQAVRPRKQGSVRQEAFVERARWYRQCRDLQDVVRVLDLGFGHLKDHTAYRGRNRGAVPLWHAPPAHTHYMHTKQ